MLFKPKGRQGPRLTELAVQTSSYGRQIPLVFGTMRVAGSVIWSTDLIERRSKQGGGKGQPSYTTYSYSASFAVALSARAIIGVGRIWAEGSLLRGAGGDWKVKTGFRLYRGGEDQAPDPLIASAEGAGLAPAHRGVAYVVFEGLPLEQFGNRIPSLTFEVIADSGTVGVGAIAAAIGGGLIQDAGVTLAVDGFSALGDGTRGVLETLAEASGAWFARAGGTIAMRTGATLPVAVTEAGAEGVRRAQARKAIDTVPRTVTVAHYDPARDWQTGTQAATRPGAGTRAVAIDVPVALSAPAARTIAEAMIARAENARTTRRVVTDSAAIAVAPGDVVRIAGEGGSWRVTQASVERLIVTLELVPLTPAPIAVAASGGRVLPAPDVAAGTTILHAFEMPALDDLLLSVPRLTIVAAGTAPGWRRAGVLYSLDSGTSWIEAGVTAAPGVIGTVTVPPEPGPATIEDRVAAIEVELAHDAMTLAGATAAALDRGTNLALIGEELIQFRSATQIAPRRWVLRDLWRARRGMRGDHVAGERFVLLDEDSALTIALPVAPGAIVQVMASGIGDDDAPATTSVLVTGASILPPAPCALREDPAAGGGATVRWRRRGRTGWRWSDGADAPLGEEREAYRVVIAATGGTRTVEAAAAEVAVTAAERIAGAVTVTVRQIGTNGLSPAAAITL